ncbi:MAG: hypothetical protein ABJF10_04840 [Chthoniobacter sp.]|uniref:hypothetical protein n=1 Tax=Chthoniobacter sp. TaxID=2510640 RepID=UPI0032AD043E
MKFSMTTHKKAFILAGLVSALVAKADQPLDKQGGSSMRSVPTSGCPAPIPYRLVKSRELCDLTEKLSDSIKDVHAAVEEWGTLALSGLLLAPPSGSFGVNINHPVEGQDKKYNFDTWFTEAGKAEGSAQFTQRVFNSLVASGTLQLAPEQAAIAQSFLQKQGVDQKLFQEQLDRNRIQRKAELQDFEQARTDSAQARQLRISAARTDADRAKAARAETEGVRNDAQRRKIAADADLQAAKDALAKPPAGANPTDLQNAVTQKQAAADQANTAFNNADADLRTQSTAETAAQGALATALESKVSTGTLTAADVTLPTDSPTLGPSNFTFSSESTPGQTITQAKAFVGAVPDASPTDISGLGDNALPKTLSNNGDTTAFPARARLIDAAGNQTISRIFDFLGDPSAALQFTDKPILMAAGTIAVNPGWRTWREYDGQIDVSAKYSWKAARRVTCDRIAKVGATAFFNPDEIAVATHFAQTGLWPTAKSSYAYSGVKKCLEETTDTPLAAGVSPLMEHQNIDEASSRTRQDEIALFLSASLAKSGQKAAADVFDKYIRLRRLDVKTRSSLPVVNSYGLGGNRFGFNVTARLQAIGNTNKPKAESLLDKQNFPILVVFGFSSEDLRPRLVRNSKTGAAEIWEPHIVLNQTHRWSRQRKRGDFHQVLRSIFYPGYPGRPMENPEKIYGLLNNASLCRERFDLFLNNNTQYRDNPIVHNFDLVAKEDYGLLQQAYFATQSILDIPVESLVGKEPDPAPAAPTTPAILNVYPSTVALREVKGTATTYEADLVIVGNKLDAVDPKKITVAPDPAPITAPVTPQELPPGVSPAQAISVKVTFSSLPKSPFQLQLPVGTAAAGQFQQYLYSPIITIAP